MTSQSAPAARLETEAEAEAAAASDHTIDRESSSRIAAANEPVQPETAQTTIGNLPAFKASSAPEFAWEGGIAGETVLKDFKQIYQEVVHWRPNCFTVPLGSSGKRFVMETIRLLQGFSEGNALESVSFLALMIMPQLLLQNPRDEPTNSHQTSHQLRVSLLNRRLDSWTAGQFRDLLQECQAIQRSLCISKSRKYRRPNTEAAEEASQARVFANNMAHGKVKAAIRMLSNNGRGQVLRLSEPADPSVPEKSVFDVLREKHPSAKPVVADALLTLQPPPFHPVIFEKITASTIHSAALHCQGAAGPSGLDASSWRRLCTMFRGASQQLCCAVASAAKRLCTENLDPSLLQPFTACRLIPLSKSSEGRPTGVRPIGICETLRRIISKAILKVVGPEIQALAGSQQLCARQKAGCEAAVHAMRTRFEDDQVEGIIFVDASNAFNNLNRGVMLRNIAASCPGLATCVTNLYRNCGQLFVGGETLESAEGTTQGDPLSMVIYALATLPLIDRAAMPGLVQSWFADDSCAGDKLTTLFSWLSVLLKEGPKYGYFINLPKTWVLVKEAHFDRAQQLFQDLNVRVTMQGRPLLGAPIGCPSFTSAFLSAQVDQWAADLKTLSAFARTQPHAAYSAFVHGIGSKWLYLARACPELVKVFAPCETVLRQSFLPALTGRNISDTERLLLSLPCRLGGLGIIDALEDMPHLSKMATSLTKPLVDHLLGTSNIPVLEVFALQQQASANTKRLTRERVKARAQVITSVQSLRLQRAVDAASDKGSSNWLTALPLTDHGFLLSKSDFKDAINIRYGWQPPRLPSICVCGKDFSVDHSMSCSHGGYLGLRHNEVRDLLGNLLDETCHNVSLEPELGPLDGEALPRATNTTDARLDIRANGFWGGSRHNCAFFDVRVFYPHAQSYRSTPIDKLFRDQEREKRRKYEHRIREVDRSSFTPLVFSSSGGAAPAATVFLKRLASLLAEKRGLPYSVVVGWLRCRLSFALLRSSILCLRGSRLKYLSQGVAQYHPQVAAAESRLHSG